MKNEAIVYELVMLDTLKRRFFVDDERVVKSVSRSLDQKGARYAVYRAKVAPLSHDRWATSMSQLACERSDAVPFFHNGELLVSSEQPAGQRMRYWSDGKGRLELVKGG